MARRRRVDWTFMHDADLVANVQEIYCARCGESSRIALPIGVLRFCKVVKSFNVLHEDCKERPALLDDRPLVQDVVALYESCHPIEVEDEPA